MSDNDASHNPYAPPKTQAILEVRPSEVLDSGGIGRLGFFAALVGVLIFGAMLLSTEGAVAFYLAALFMLVPVGARFKNIGRSPAWCLLLFVPVVGLLIVVPCLLFPAGYQKHRTFDAAARIQIGGLVILAIYLLAWVYLMTKSSW